MSRRPLSSSRVSTFDLESIASMTACSTSDGDWALSNTSSRGANCTPILTSTYPPLLFLLGFTSREREARDAAPCQCRHELHSLRFLDLATTRQPVPRGDLGGAGQADGQKLSVWPTDGG